MGLQLVLSPDQERGVDRLLQATPNGRARVTRILTLPADDDRFYNELAIERGVDSQELGRALVDLFLSYMQECDLDAGSNGIGEPASETLQDQFGSFIRDERAALAANFRVTHPFARTLTGAEALGFWKRTGALGAWSDRAETSLELAEEFRRDAEMREDLAS